jgi:hypothetical protein
LKMHRAQLLPIDPFWSGAIAEVMHRGPIYRAL